MEILQEWKALRVWRLKNLKVALNLYNIPFGITGDEAVCTEYGLKAEGVITVKIFDDGKALLTKGVSALT